MNPLCLPQTEYQEVFDRIQRLSLQYLENIEHSRTFPDTNGADSQRFFARALPEHGMGAAALDDLSHVVELARAQGPRFFGYVLGSGEPVAAACDLLASALNQNVTAWRSSPSAISIEQVVVRWLGLAIGCEGFYGSLTGGGSPANLMGLAMAREMRTPANETGVAGRGCVYASAQVHMSIAKAVALLGIGRENLRLIGCDEEFRIDIRELRPALERDVRAGLTPLAIVGSAGTTATGAIDSLEELGALAREFGTWFHVDGAYGALAAIAVPEKFRGLALADSLSLDPHKWLYQPLDCGCLLFRDREAARRTFGHTGDYAKSQMDDPVENFEFFEESMELSRRFRALKLWVSLRYHGLENFREAIRNDLDCAAYFASRVDSEAELERLAPVPLSAVCFRYVPQGARLTETELDSLNRRILQTVMRRGKVFFSNASIHDRFALRICVVNHRSTRDDLDEVVREVLHVGRELSQGTHP